jgi:hypothetical protein
MLAPGSELGQFMKKPFVKFITHSASYAFFLSKIYCFLMTALFTRMIILQLSPFKRFSVPPVTVWNFCFSSGSEIHGYIRYWKSGKNMNEALYQD